MATDKFIFMPKGVPVEYEFEENDTDWVIEAIADNVKRNLKHSKELELELKMLIKDGKLITEVWMR